MRYYKRDTRTTVAIQHDFTMRHYLEATDTGISVFSNKELDAHVPDMPPSLAMQIINKWNRDTSARFIYFLQQEDAGL